MQAIFYKSRKNGPNYKNACHLTHAIMKIFDALSRTYQYVRYVALSYISPLLYLDEPYR